MNVSEHLTKEQIAGYAADSLAHEEKREIGRHLLQCADCRNLLPVPTTEQFWSALMGESERDENFSVEKHSSSSKKSPFSAIFSFFQPSSTMAWSAGAFVFVAAFSLFIWLGATKQSNSSGEIAQTVESPKVLETPIIENIQPGNKNLPVSISVDSSKNANSNIENAENSQPAPLSKQSKGNPIIVRENSKISEKTEDRELAVLLDNTPPAVSSLRSNEKTVLRSGGSNNQTTDSAGGFALLTPVGETVLETAPEFRWNPAANAKGYKISIFDEDFNEVLTAQVSGNSFKPDKPLKHGAKYLWRVAAQTDEGETLAPRPPHPPAMFRIAEEKTENRIESLKNNKNNRFRLAVFYAKEGMLDAAQCTLLEILREKPNHKAARRLLAKVRQWKEENQTFTQRCGPPPTETKPAQ